MIKKSMLAMVVMAGCSGSAEVEVTREVRADMRWDHLPQATAWTDAALNALAGHGAALENLVPADIETWCPAYGTASIEQRRLFWSGMLSALAKHESTWNQRAIGGNGRWFGLVQIAPATARGYGCDARSGEALLNGEANLSCAVRIAAHTVVRDGVVAANGRGLAADWGPFHSTRKRNDMIEWTNAQSYCAL